MLGLSCFQGSTDRRPTESSMVKPIIMPKYGLQQDEGTVVRWLKEEGEQVDKGELLLEVESDKAVFEYESPEAGILRKIVAEEGAVVPVLSLIAVITEGPGESYDLDRLSAAPATDDVSPTEVPTPTVAPDARAGGRVKASPAARKRARQLRVDLETVAGTGPGGRITTEDVEASAGSETGPAAPDGPVPLTKIRKAIGKAMSASKATVPHFYVDIDVDMTDAEAWRKEAASGDLSVTDLVVKAAAHTLAQMPALNASLLGEDAVEHHKRVHIGLAVGTDQGLLVPVMEDAQAKSLRVLASERREIVEAARVGRMRSGERATFTVSNLGMFGVTSFTAVINPPEAAILALGAILPQVRAGEDGLSISVRRMMNATLSADHRLTEGVAGAQFLGTFKAALESRETLEGWL